MINTRGIKLNVVTIDKSNFRPNKNAVKVEWVGMD
jgi:hypothetical protein